MKVELFARGRVADEGSGETRGGAHAVRLQNTGFRYRNSFVSCSGLFAAASNQDTVFEHVCFHYLRDRRSATFLFFGASGGGKTYTLEGDWQSDNLDEHGILPRALHYLSSQGTEAGTSVELSFFEFSDRGGVRDVLATSSAGARSARTKDVFSGSGDSTASIDPTLAALNIRVSRIRCDHESDDVLVHESASECHSRRELLLLQKLKTAYFEGRQQAKPGNATCLQLRWGTTSCLRFVELPIPPSELRSLGAAADAGGKGGDPEIGGPRLQQNVRGLMEGLQRVAGRGASKTLGRLFATTATASASQHPFASVLSSLVFPAPQAQPFAPAAANSVAPLVACYCFRPEREAEIRSALPLLQLLAGMKQPSSSSADDHQEAGAALVSRPEDASSPGAEGGLANGAGSSNGAGFELNLGTTTTAKGAAQRPRLRTSVRAHSVSPNLQPVDLRGALNDMQQLQQQIQLGHPHHLQQQQKTKHLSTASTTDEQRSTDEYPAANLSSHGGVVSGGFQNQHAGGFEMDCSVGCKEPIPDETAPFVGTTATSSASTIPPDILSPAKFLAEENKPSHGQQFAMGMLPQGASSSSSATGWASDALQQQLPVTMQTKTLLSDAADKGQMGRHAAHRGKQVDSQAIIHDGFREFLDAAKSMIAGLRREYQPESEKLIRAIAATVQQMEEGRNVQYDGVCCHGPDERETNLKMVLEKLSLSCTLSQAMEHHHEDLAATLQALLPLGEGNSGDGRRTLPAPKHQYLSAPPNIRTALRQLRKTAQATLDENGYTTRASSLAQPVAAVESIASSSNQQLLRQQSASAVSRELRHRGLKLFQFGGSSSSSATPSGTALPKLQLDRLPPPIPPDEQGRMCYTINPKSLDVDEDSDSSEQEDSSRSGGGPWSQGQKGAGDQQKSSSLQAVGAGKLKQRPARTFGQEELHLGEDPGLGRVELQGKSPPAGGGLPRGPQTAHSPPAGGISSSTTTQAQAAHQRQTMSFHVAPRAGMRSASSSSAKVSPGTGTSQPVHVTQKRQTIANAVPASSEKKHLARSESRPQLPTASAAAGAGAGTLSTGALLRHSPMQPPPVGASFWPPTRRLALSPSPLRCTFAHVEPRPVHSEKKEYTAGGPRTIGRNTANSSSSSSTGVATRSIAATATPQGSSYPHHGSPQIMTQGGGVSVAVVPPRGRDVDSAAANNRSVGRFLYGPPPKIVRGFSQLQGGGAAGAAQQQRGAASISPGQMRKSNSAAHVGNKFGPLRGLVTPFLGGGGTTATSYHANAAGGGAGGVQSAMLNGQPRGNIGIAAR